MMMNMVLSKSVIAFSLIFAIFFSNENFIIDFEDEIEKAFLLQKKIYNIFKSRVELMENDYQICSSIIFPELVRYSLIRQKLENMILTNLYTIHGSRFADKSVGIFQIKPTFVELLEEELKKYKELKKYSFIWKYPEGLSKIEKRKIRAERMLDLVWQIDYLISFVSLLDHFYKSNENSLKFNNKREKIAFYSSAYNCGHWFDKEKIEYYMGKNFFPSDLGKIFRKYNYSDISLFYYDKIF